MRLFRIFLALLAFCSFSFGAIEDEQSVFRDLFPKSDTKPNKPVKQENDSFVPSNKPMPTDNAQNPHESFNNTFSAKSFFLSYEDLPKKAYVNQIIPLHVKAVITKEFTNIKLKNPKNGTIYVEDINWTKKEGANNTYIATIFLQVKSTSFPKLKATLYNNGVPIETASFPKADINILKTGNDGGKFIHVLASNLELKKSKTTQFDEDSLITVMDLKAQNANADDINFSNVIKQGIDSKSGEYPNEEIYYFIVYKAGVSKITFSYFNTVSNSFEKINVPIVIEQDDLSTQIDLNPKKSKYELYKDIVIVVFALILAVLFIYKKRWVYLVLLIAIMIYVVFFKINAGEITIKEGAKIRILPTENSTIFYTITKPTQAEQLNSIKSYIKILLPDGKIGWVRNEDASKN